MAMISQVPRSPLTYPSRPGNQDVIRSSPFSTSPSLTLRLPGCTKERKRGKGRKRGKEKRRGKGKKAKREEKSKGTRNPQIGRSLSAYPANENLHTLPFHLPPEEGGAASPLEPLRNSPTLARPLLRSRLPPPNTLYPRLDPNSIITLMT